MSGNSSRDRSPLGSTPSTEAFDFPEVYGDEKRAGESTPKPHFLEVVAIQSYTENELRQDAESPNKRTASIDSVTSPSLLGRKTSSESLPYGFSTPTTSRGPYGDFSPKSFETPLPLDEISVVHEAIGHATEQLSTLKGARGHALRERDQLRKTKIHQLYEAYIVVENSLRNNYKSIFAKLDKSSRILKDVWTEKDAVRDIEQDKMQAVFQAMTLTPEMLSQLKSDSAAAFQKSTHDIEASIEQAVTLQEEREASKKELFRVRLEKYGINSHQASENVREEWYGWLEKRLKDLQDQSSTRRVIAEREHDDFVEVELDVADLNKENERRETYQSVTKDLKNFHEQSLQELDEVKQYVKLVDEEEKNFIFKQAELVDLELAHLKKARAELEKVQARFAADLVEQVERLKRARVDVRVETVELSKSEEEVRLLREIVGKIRWEGEEASTYLSLLSSADKESREREEHRGLALAEQKAGVSVWSEDRGVSVEGGKLQVLSVDVCKQLLDELSSVYKAIGHVSGQLSEVKQAREHAEKELYELRKAHVHHKHFLYHESLGQIEKYRSQQEVLLQRVSELLEDVWRKKDEAVGMEIDELSTIFNAFISRIDGSEKVAGLDRKEFAKLFDNIKVTLGAAEKIYSKRHQSKAKQFQGHVDRFKAVHDVELADSFARQEWYGWLENSVSSLFSALELAEAEVDNSFNNFVLLDGAADAPYRELLSVLQRQLEKILRDETKIKDWTKMLEEEEKTFAQKHAEWIDQEIAHLIKVRGDLEKAQDHFAADLLDQIEQLKRLRVDVRVETVELSKSEEEVRLLRETVGKIRWEGEEAAAFLSLLNSADDIRRIRNEHIFAAEDEEKLIAQAWPENFEIDINDYVLELTDKVCFMLLDDLSAVYKAVGHASSQLSEMKQAREYAEKELYELRKAHVHHKHFLYHESLGQIEKYRSQQEVLLQRVPELLEEVWKQKEGMAVREMTDITTLLNDFVAKVERSEKRKEITEESAARNMNLLEGVRKFLYVARAAGKQRYSDKSRVFDVQRDKYAVTERPNPSVCETAVEEWYGWLVSSMAALDDALDSRNNKIEHRYDSFMRSAQVDYELYDAFLMDLDSDRERVQKDMGRIIELNKMLDYEEKNHILKQQSLVDEELNNLQRAREEIEKAQAQLAADLQGDKQHLEKLRAHIDAEKEALMEEEKHLDELRKEVKDLRKTPRVLEREPRVRESFRSVANSVEAANRLFPRERPSPGLGRLSAGSAMNTPFRNKKNLFDPKDSTP